MEDTAVPSGWLGSNLRHFMSHLAPGVYFSLQVAVFLLFAAWLIDPGVLKIFDKLGTLEAAPSAFFGFVLITICYFVGLTLRLPTVDHVDVRSIDYKLTSELWDTRRERSAGFRRWGGLREAFDRMVWFFCYHGSRALAAHPKAITVRGARCRLLKGSGDASLKNLLDGWERMRGRQWIMEAPIQDADGELLRVAIAQVGIQTLISEKLLVVKRLGRSARVLTAASPDGHYENMNAWVKNSEVIQYSEWFALADSYPYPIRMLYWTWHRANDNRRRELAKHYVPLMLETVIGEKQGRRYTHGPVNRAKEHIIARDRRKSLSAFVLEREAITRMVAGFYPALKIGLWGSFVLAVFCVVRLLLLWYGYVAAAPRSDWTTADIDLAWQLLALGFSTFFVCNAGLLTQVLRNLRPIRYAEVDAVMEGYLLCRIEERDGEHSACTMVTTDG
jgi:hypothetical protein